MKEMRDECKEFESKKDERHRKRLERQQKGRNGDGGDGLRPPNRRLQSSSSPDLRYGGPPRPTRYIDDNPYNQAPVQPPPGDYGYGYNDRK